MKFVHNEYKAEDLVQDTFAAALQNMHTFHGDDMRPWLARIAANKCKDYLKSAAVRHASATDIDELPEQRDQQPLPGVALETSEGVQRIINAIDALPLKYKNIAQLFYLHGRTPQQIARQLQIPPATIYTRLARGKKLLQESLKGEYPEYE